MNQLSCSDGHWTDRIICVDYTEGIGCYMGCGFVWRIAQNRGWKRKVSSFFFFSLKDCTKLVHSVSRKRMFSFNSYSYLMKQHVLSWIFDW